jgi:hypothetical protein
VVIEGKLLLRTLVQQSIDWDEPLPECHRNQWQKWKNSLAALEQVSIPRTYASSSLRDCPEKSIHVYSDASEKAIAVVAYVKTGDTDGKEGIGFLLGKAKLAPSQGHTMPRLELCAAVLTTELVQCTKDHLNIPVDSFHMYSDSKVTLGYIHNQVRRFYTYVSNRVACIHKVTSPNQWIFVPTERNPADLTTRYIATSELSTSSWLLGPSQHRETSMFNLNRLTFKTQTRTKKSDH